MPRPNRDLKEYRMRSDPIFWMLVITFIVLLLMGGHSIMDRTQAYKDLQKQTCNNITDEAPTGGQEGKIECNGKTIYHLEYFEQPEQDKWGNAETTHFCYNVTNEDTFEVKTYCRKK